MLETKLTTRVRRTEKRRPLLTAPCVSYSNNDDAVGGGADRVGLAAWEQGGGVGKVSYDDVFLDQALCFYGG